MWKNAKTRAASGDLKRVDEGQEFIRKVDD